MRTRLRRSLRHVPGCRATDALDRHYGGMRRRARVLGETSNDLMACHESD
jgi:hypothetical protein